MKILFNKLFTLFRRYKTTLHRLHEMTTTFSAFKSTIFGMLIALLLLTLPLAIIINMFIFTKLSVFLSILIVLIINAWVLLYYKFYFILLGYYHPKVKDLNTKYIYWIETSMINLIILLLGSFVIVMLN